MNADIDSRFFGNLTLALEDEDGATEVAVEEAWIQTTGLSTGLTLRGGRYFSGIGYLNSFHRHADDFGDRPLPYQAFFGGQYIPDGAQIRWVAPSALLLEFGAELNWGSGNGSSPDDRILFLKVGGDMGASNSWQFGISYLSQDVSGRGGESVGGPPNEVFSGDSDLVGLDFVLESGRQTAIRQYEISKYRASTSTVMNPELSRSFPMRETRTAGTCRGSGNSAKVGVSATDTTLSMPTMEHCLQERFSKILAAVLREIH